MTILVLSRFYFGFEYLDACSSSGAWGRMAHAVWVLSYCDVSAVTLLLPLGRLMCYFLFLSETWVTLTGFKERNGAFVGCQPYYIELPVFVLLIERVASM